MHVLSAITDRKLCCGNRDTVRSRRVGEVGKGPKQDSGWFEILESEKLPLFTCRACELTHALLGEC